MKSACRDDRRGNPVTRTRHLRSYRTGALKVGPPRIGLGKHAGPISRATVHLWYRRYRAEGLAGLVDRPRSGRPTVLNRRAVERILLLTTERVPVEATHWSTRLMARYRRRHAVAGAAGLAGRRPQAASAQDLQAQSGSAVRRESHRRRRALPQRARRCAGPLGRREDADAGARPDPSDAAPAARAGRAPHPRRHATRDHESVRGLQHRDRRGVWTHHPAPSRHGVPPVPRADRTRDAGRRRAAPDRRQQQYAHDPSRFETSWPPIPAFSCISRRPARRGSMRSRPGSASWSGAPSGVASSPV